jgi:hypothetical protein
MKKISERHTRPGVSAEDRGEEIELDELEKKDGALKDARDVFLVWSFCWHTRTHTHARAHTHTHTHTLTHTAPERPPTPVRHPFCLTRPKYLIGTNNRV